MKKIVATFLTIAVLVMSIAAVAIAEEGESVTVPTETVTAAVEIAAELAETEAEVTVEAPVETPEETEAAEPAEEEADGDEADIQEPEEVVETAGEETVAEEPVETEAVTEELATEETAAEPAETEAEVTVEAPVETLEETEVAERAVSFISNHADEEVEAGTEIILTAVLEGFEGCQYTVCWQYTDDGGETVIDAGYGETFTYEASEENANRLWRVVVILAD